MTVRELVVELILKATGLKQGLADAERGLAGVTDAAQKTERQAERTGKALTAAAKDGQGAWENLKGAILGVASVAGIVGAATNFAEQTKQLAQYSSQLGMTVEQWQAWQGAAQSMGIEAQDLYDTFRDMSDWTIDMVKNDSGPFKDFAKQTGLSLKDAKGNMVGAEEALLRLSKAVEGMKPDEATGWLTQMGVDPTNISLILKGRKGIEDLVRSMREKAVYDERDIQNSNKMQAAWTDVTRVFQRLAATAINMVAPAFDWIQEKADSLFKFVKNNEESVTRVFKGIAAVIGVALIPKLYAMGKAAMVSMGPWGLLVAAVSGLIVLFDDFMVWLDNGQSAFGDFFESIFGSADEAKKTFEDIKKTIASVVDFILSIPDRVSKAFDEMGKTLAAFPEALLSAFRGLKDRILGLLPDFIRDKIEIKGEVAPVEEDENVSRATQAAQSGKGPTIEKRKPAPVEEPEPDDYQQAQAWLRSTQAPQPNTGNMRQALVATGGYGAGDAARGARTVNTTNNKNINQTVTQNINITTQSDQPAAVGKAAGDAVNPKTATVMADGAVGV